MRIILMAGLIFDESYRPKPAYDALVDVLADHQPDMHRHRYFNLGLHDDEELSPLVRASIAERVTLHEWPLSCVHRLTTSDGRRVIYKSQFGPTVESEFYANARSDLLPAAETVYDSDGYVCMLIEFVEGPLLRDLDLPEAELVGVGREVMAQIRDISGELPFVVDISTEQGWWKLVEATLQDLRGLINQGRFRLVNSPIVDDLERWAFSEPVRSAIRMDPGYVHGDFGGGNVFVLPDGYRVIDWQRPNVGPTDLDLATLLESSGFDPLRFVDEGVVGVMYFLRLHWLTQCAVRWIPEGVKIYDEQIARLASLIRWR